MAADYLNRRNSNTQLLEELEALSQSLYQTHHNTSTNRRTASLALPRTSAPLSAADGGSTAKSNDKSSSGSTARPRSRRMSLTPWRSRPKHDEDDDSHKAKASTGRPEIKKLDEERASEKKGIWNWKPIRALSHIRMQKLSCLFSVEVVTVQGLPPSMNGLRLSVCVRKKETKDGSVHTMPSRVSQGAADFEETLFVRCHLYCTPGSGSGKQLLKFEPRPFWIYAFAVDAEDLDFGRGSVDLSQLIQESMEKNLQGIRVRQWDTSFDLSGKAKGGELVLKLGFQIMEKDGGIDIYSQGDQGLKSSKSRNFSPASFGRKQSKTSFSVPSPRLTSRAEAWTPSQTRAAAAELQGIDDLNLDEPTPVLAPKKEEQEQLKMEDDFPDFEVVDKGVEIQDIKETGTEESQENVEGKSASSEVVKEMVHDQVHLTRLTELDSIAQQIKALESMMGTEEKIVKTEDERGSQKLDAEEETVTREFLQMLEDEEEANNRTFNFSQVEIIPPFQLEESGDVDSAEAEAKVYLADLGKGLGCVVQTRDGGYLTAMNPLDVVLARKDTPKLAMQLSKPLVVPLNKSMTGFELFQRMAAVGFEELSSQLLSLMPLDELLGKTAEQIAFEGIASAIIQGRNKEGASSSSSAARTIATVKAMATAMSTGRKERISTGIWNVSEEPLTVEEILAFSLQKIEAMAIEALKIQAEMAEEEAPFDVTGSSGKEQTSPLALAISLEEWIKRCSLSSTNGKAPEEMSEGLGIAVVVQLRDPLRRYETVGGPVVALVHAASSADDIKDEEEKRFKVTSLHFGGLKAKTEGESRNMWDTERQRLTAMQWLVAYGVGKGVKKGGKQLLSKGQDLLWSISSRIVADMWLKPMRNPDVKFAKSDSE